MKYMEMFTVKDGESDMEKIFKAEQAVLLWIQENLRNDFLTPVFIFITKLGDAGFIFMVLVVLLLVFPKTRKTGLVAGVSLGGTSVLVNLILKKLFCRVRPYEWGNNLELLIEKQSDYSFPSGHTAAAFAVAVVIYRMMPKKYGVPALVFAFVMGFSRIYVGVHYLGDVVGGALTGTAVALITVAGYRKISEKIRKGK